jgi:hypothetical protein
MPFIFLKHSMEKPARQERRKGNFQGENSGTPCLTINYLFPWEGTKADIMPREATIEAMVEEIKKWAMGNG